MRVHKEYAGPFAAVAKTASCPYGTYGAARPKDVYRSSSVQPALSFPLLMRKPMLADTKSLSCDIIAVSSEEGSG